MTGEELILIAEEARKNACAPYSGFAVGAALLSADNKVYTGCNIENSSFGATCCAERVALFSAVAAGEKTFSALAIAGGKSGEGVNAFCPPCGICRQALSEFCSPEFPVYLTDGGQIKVTTLGTLLPEAFTKENIPKKGERHETV
ncbi:MAG: cytidine deaminase [Clostridia bacterium]|nr:cytidine deaminase [Clostridia bacterium]